MARETLFAILSRQPWWMSAGIALALFAAVRLLLPDLVAAAMTLPFLVVAVYAGWRQLRAPSMTNVAETLDRLRAMPWENFSAVMDEAFRRDGYSVAEGDAGAADFELNKNGRVTVVSCRRWKVAHTGTGPLRELYKARRTREAHESIYVAAGDFTAQARAYASERAITLLNGAALGKLVARVDRGRPRWFSRWFQR